MAIYKGKAWRFGDHVDTDAILPATYLTLSDPDELAEHCFETAHPEFCKNGALGDIMVGGVNFGCGSSREHAPVAIKAMGISCVIADSFARIFYRNAFNIGLPVLESPQAARAVTEGQQLIVDLDKGSIENLSSGEIYSFEPIPVNMQAILSEGGLMEYLAAHGSLAV